MIMWVYEGVSKDDLLIGTLPADAVTKRVTYDEVTDPGALGADIEREINERDGKNVTIVIEVLPDDTRQYDHRRCTCLMSLRNRMKANLKSPTQYGAHHSRSCALYDEHGLRGI